jgi:hypothetical protein
MKNGEISIDYTGPLRIARRMQFDFCLVQEDFWII